MSAPARAARPFAKVGELIANIDPPPRLRRLLRLAGYPVFALIVALFAFSSALPADRVKDRLEQLLSQDPSTMQPLGLGMDVKAGDFSLSLLRRGIHADNVVLRTRPLRIADKPSRFILDSVDVKVGLFALLLQRVHYSFDVEAFRGTVSGSGSVALSGNKYDITGSELDLGSVLGLQTAAGVPIEGKLEGKIDLEAPDKLLAKSSGSIELAIDGASVGDGKSKVVIPGDPFLALGFTLPRIKIGKVTASLVIEKGKARIENLRAHSVDGDVTLEGYVDLRDPLPLSQLHLFLRFKLSDALVKREPSMELATNSLSALGKRTDGFIGAQLTGSFASPQLLASKVPPPGVTSKAEPAAPGPAVPSPSPSPPPPPPSALPPPPPASTDAATAAPVEPQQPTTPPPAKDGVILPPPPAMRMGARGAAAEEGGTVPPPPPPPAPAPAE